MHSCLSMNLFATFAFLLPGHPTLSTTFDYLKQRKKTAEKIDTNAQWFHCSWSILLKRVNIRVRGFHLVSSAPRPIFFLFSAFFSGRSRSGILFWFADCRPLVCQVVPQTQHPSRSDRVSQRMRRRRRWRMSWKRRWRASRRKRWRNQGSADVYCAFDNRHWHFYPWFNPLILFFAGA